MCGGAAICGAAMCGAGACGAGAAILGGAETCGIAGAACGIAGAGRAAAGGGPPRPPPCGGSAIAATVESARTETADIAARRTCIDITKLRNETFRLKCAHGRQRSRSRSREIAADGWRESDSAAVHEIVIDPGVGNGNRPRKRE